MKKIQSANLLATVFFVCLSAKAQTASGSPGHGYFCRALGDSLTAGFIDRSTKAPVNYPAFLQAMGTCSVVTNEGVSGQISTEIAVRSGGLPTTGTITGGVIPPIGPVEIVFKPFHEPTTRYSTFSVPMSISGVDGSVAHVGSTNMFTRAVPGPPVPSGPDAPVSIITGTLNDGFVIIWAGKNNAYKPDQVVSDIAAIVDFLPKPKKFVVLSVTNGNINLQWRGGKLYTVYMALDATLASTYPHNFIDIRKVLVEAYDPKNPEDVIDHGHDDLPSSLRYFEDSTLTTPIPDTSSCASIPAPLNYASTVQIDEEKIYVINAGKGFAADRGCIRGYASTTATTHNAGAPVRASDGTHLNATGYMLVAKTINAWMLANLK